MSKKNKDKQLRIRGELAERIKKIAEKNGASETFIGNLTVTAGIPIVERNLEEMKKAAA